ncbi:hypothetical protein [Prochlorococcus sp. MIT 1341]|uniref:hypothetical protein n=1 Tax=Prochlorococcus sp. MIT 1341 TaxID=3096221 RepID=UPI002A755137|nr:hypothetical protein [Prochlorococcus sp. MIT 1341]
MVAVKQPRSISLKEETFRPQTTRSLELLQGALSTRKIARHSPRVAGFHRIVDGALLGTCLALTFISALTLHWQYRWTIDFTRLENTRKLAHRFTESTAMLEQHLLKRGRLPGLMVSTKASDLLYLDQPSGSIGGFDAKGSFVVLNKVFANHIIHGY